ncbi:transglycosylase SLT domain-containing protein [Kaistia terrae]|uniref:Transglycosylase SLT domain-containing protein n=1 Tax=Kaistia terrae TaxID=537017 RepID=A0ABW0PZQ0_9HYPH|nr:transglycosylase SLT domain-containing protein [Kaistia terrae]MCX5578938.1 transglycosylase SLT domain-containing protein [Kaistia terrae]
MRGLIGLSLGLLIPTVALADRDMSRAEIEARIAYYADTYRLPVELLRKVVRTESTFNPAARNGPYWGLMQILPKTAEGLGYRGSAKGLLDAETNLIYGGAYLANAYIIAGGNAAKAHSLYKSGYYYEAKRKRLLAKLIKVPMGTTPILVAGKLVTKPSDNTMLAYATPEPGSPVVAKAPTEKLVLAEGAKPEIAAEADAAPVAVATAMAPVPLRKPVVAAPVVEMAAIVPPLLPRPKPAALLQLASAKPASTEPAAANPAAPPVRGLLYATAILPPSKVIRPDYAEQTIAQPELALASASSHFAKDATAMAFATPTPSRLSSAHKLPAAIRLASTDDGIRSDAPGCCRMDASVDAAMPLPRARPAHKAD